MSLWFGGAANACDLCGHRETAREVVRGTAPRSQSWGDFVFSWGDGTMVCHWCAQRVHGYSRYIGERRS